jgi:uncharacterized caspase-like protein/tetratricopeptide (TPR) repeat protein
MYGGLARIKFLALAAAVAGLPLFVCPHGLAQGKASQSGRGIQTKASPAVNTWPGATKRYALLIGIDQYKDRDITPLNYASKDAENLANVLVEFAGFPKDQVVLLTSNQSEDFKPSRSTIAFHLNRLLKQVPKDGVLLFSYAGHGIEQGGEPFLLPEDARVSNDVELLKITALSLKQLSVWITNSGIGQVVVLLDACRNDPVQSRGLAPNAMSEDYRRALNLEERNRGIQAFATLYATGVGEQAWESQEQHRGFFLGAVADGVKGAAANPAGEVTLGGLIRYVEGKVPEQARKEGKEQKPFHDVGGGYKADELVIALAPLAAAPAGAASGQPAAIAQSKITIEPEVLDYEFWKTVESSQDPADFEDYVKKFPNGMYAGLAKRRILRLRGQTSAAASEAAKPAAAPAATPPPSSPPPAAVPKGTLFIFTTPSSADVVVKDSQGATVAHGRSNDGRFKTELAAGSYTVHVSADGYSPFTGKQALVIGPGQQEALDARLSTLPNPRGSIILMSPTLISPDAVILLDGSKPSGLKLAANRAQIDDITPGSHTVLIAQVGMLDWQSQVEVRAGQPAYLTAQFSPARVELTVTCEPGAVVYLDGVPRSKADATGKTEVITASAGQHTVGAMKDGFEPEIQTKTFLAGKIQVALNLKPKPSVPGARPPAPIAAAAPGPSGPATGPAPSQPAPSPAAPKADPASTTSKQPVSAAVSTPAAGSTAAAPNVGSTASKQPAPSSSAEPSPASSAPATLTGSIILLCPQPVDSNTQVLLNGRPVEGFKVSAGRIELNDIPPGANKVTVRQKGLEWEDTIAVKPASLIYTNVVMRAPVVILVVKGEPGSDVYVDGALKAKIKDSGQTDSLRLSPGQHSLKASKKEYISAEKTATFQAGAATIDLTVTAKPKPAVEASAVAPKPASPPPPSAPKPVSTSAPDTAKPASNTGPETAKPAASTKPAARKRAVAEAAMFNEARGHYLKARELSTAGKSAEALAEFEQSAAIDPATAPDFAELYCASNAYVAEMRYQLGADLVNGGKKDQAKANFEAAMQSIEKAILTAGSLNSPSVRADLPAYFGIQAKNVKVLVEFYGENGFVGPEIKALDRARELEPGNRKWEVLKGDLYRYSAQYDSALASYTAVLTANSDDLDALYGIGLTLVTYNDKGSLEKALGYLERFVKTAQGAGPAWSRKVASAKAAIEALKNEFKTGK